MFVYVYDKMYKIYYASNSMDSFLIFSVDHAANCIKFKGP